MNTFEEEKKAHEAKGDLAATKLMEQLAESEYPIFHDMDQCSEDWYTIRCGKMTSSRFATVLAKGKGGGVSKTRRKYMSEICSERKTGLPSSSFSGTTAMDWGTEHEDEAVGAYEKEKEREKGDGTSHVVNTVGFVELSGWIGGSPDGLVGEDGIIEVKCPNSCTHYDYMRLNKKDPSWYDPTYKWQMQGNLWITGRKWCDWISYDPRFKLPKEQILIVRVERDEQAIAELQIKCELFKKEALAEILSSNPF
jgi:hypothetical protein